MQFQSIKTEKLYAARVNVKIKKISNAHNFVTSFGSFLGGDTTKIFLTQINRHLLYIKF